MSTCLMLVSRSWRTMQWRPRYSKWARQVTRLCSGCRETNDYQCFVKSTLVSRSRTLMKCLWVRQSVCHRHCLGVKDMTNLNKCVEDVSLPLDGPIVGRAWTEELQSHQRPVPHLIWHFNWIVAKTRWFMIWKDATRVTNRALPPRKGNWSDYCQNSHRCPLVDNTATPRANLRRFNDFSESTTINSFRLYCVSMPITRTLFWGQNINSELRACH